MKQKQKQAVRKAAAIATVMTLSVSLLAACGNGKENASSPVPTGTSATATTTTTTPSKHYDVTVALQGVATTLANPDKDALLQKVQNELNLTLKPQGITADDFDQKFKLWAASGQLPDMMVYEMSNGATVSQWIKQELVREIPEKLYSKYPNLSKIMSSPEAQATKVNGKFYGLPRLTNYSPDDYAIQRGYIVRKDWMDKLGIKTPKTFDEYLAMFKAFAEKDPDGNGKSDTVGMTTNYLDVLNSTVKLGSSVPNLSFWMKEDDKWIPAFASKGMADYVTKYRKLYAEGALDKDYALLKVGEGGDKFAQGNVGALNIQLADTSLKAVKDKWDKFPHDKSFEDSVTVLPSWSAPDGNTYRFYQSSFTTEIYFNSAVDDNKLDALLKLIDFNLSDKGKDLYTYGIEGTDFKKENGKIVILQKPQYASIGAFAYMNGLGWTLNTAKEFKEATIPGKLIDMSAQLFGDLLKNAKPIPLNFNVDGLITPTKSKVAGINWSDAVVKVVLGKDDPVKMWQDAYSKFDQKVINDAIQEVNDAVAKNGIK